MPYKFYKSANYSGGGTGGGWPVLTSLTKVPHRSGLLALSATFTRPKGNTATVTEIEGVPIFGEPSVSRSSDAMEQISAVAYDVWDGSKSEEVINISVYDMPVYYRVRKGEEASEGYSISTRVVMESGWIKKIGSGIPTLSRNLAIISPTFFSINIPQTGQNVSGSPILGQSLSMVRQNIYGSVTETEAAYELRPYINLGVFTI
jgi:hypothetical protein